METLKTQLSSDIQASCYRIVRMLFTCFFVLSLLGPFDLPAQLAEESVQAAYELRMKGETDNARAMLQNILDRDQSDGLAHYELSRLKLAQLLGGGKVEIGSVIKSASQAVKADSQDVAFAYMEASAMFLQAYRALMEESENARKMVDEATACYERVLVLKPDYHETRMQLIEFYFALPEEMGGNKEKAAAHARELDLMDWFFAAQAGEIMRPEESSRTDYWQQVFKERAGDLRVKKQLGLAYLQEGNLEQAKPLFEEVMKADPASHTLVLDVARYHLYQVMWDRSKAEEELPLAEKAIREYLSLEPEPIAPLKAWALSNLARIHFFSGQEEEGKKLMAEATALDPFFSKASDVPGMGIYIPPGEIYRPGEYSSFLRPF